MISYLLVSTLYQMTKPEILKKYNKIKGVFWTLRKQKTQMWLVMDVTLAQERLRQRFKE